MQIAITLLLTILVSGPTAAGVEWCRYKIEYGKKANLDKWFSKAIAVVLFVVLVWCLDLWEWQTLILAGFAAFARGVFYDPFLNLFFDRFVDQESETTNSEGDKAERRRGWSFWEQRLYYGIAAAVFLTLYIYFKW